MRFCEDSYLQHTREQTIVKNELYFILAKAGCQQAKNIIYKLRVWGIVVYIYFQMLKTGIDISNTKYTWTSTTNMDWYFSMHYFSTKTNRPEQNYSHTKQYRL